MRFILCCKVHGYKEKKEHSSNQKKIFKSLSKEHHKLFVEMKSDLNNPKERYQFDFYLGHRQGLSSHGDGYVYYIDEHPELESIIKLLQSKSCISKISSGYKGHVSQYRFNEWFVNQLIKWNPNFSAPAA